MHRSVSSLAVSATLACVGLFAGCAHESLPMPEEPQPPVVEEAPKLPDGSLDRASLELVLRRGPGWLLSRVPIEEVVEDGKFVGWRITEVPLEWKDVDLVPGDVVTSVNAMPIETPNDFWAAWTSLSVASELKVSYLREGEPLEASFPIYGSPTAGLADDMKRDEPPPAEQPQPGLVPANQQYNNPKQEKTITIESHEKPLNETLVDWSN